MCIQSGDCLKLHWALLTVIHFVLSGGALGFDTRVASVFQDSEMKLNADQVAARFGEFQKVDSDEVFAFQKGYLWFSFNVTNAGEAEVQKFLRLRSAMVKEVMIFELGASGWKKSGVIFPDSYAVPHITLAAGESRNLLARTQFFSHSTFQPEFQDLESLVENLFFSSGYRFACYFVYLGLLVLGFFGFAGRVAGRYYYLGYVFCMTIVLMVMGYDLKAIFGLDLASFSLTLASLTVSLGTEFVYRFFATSHRSPMFRRIFTGAAFVGAFCFLVLIFTLDSSIRWVFDLYAACCSILSFVYIMVGIRERLGSSIMYLLSTLAQTIHFVIFIAPSYGIMPPNNYASNALFTGFVFHLLLITAAIFVRFRELTDSLNRSLLSANTQLEDKIADRTSVLEAQKLKLMDAAKIAGVADMARAMAFQVNHPLSEVLGYCRRYFILDSRGLPDPKEVTSIITTIENAGNQIRTTIERLRMLSVSEQGGVCDDVVVARIFADLKGLCDVMVQEEGVALKIEMPPHSLRASCVHGKIVRLLFQLVLNSVEAISEDYNSRIEISAKEHNGMVEIWVKDSGSITDPDIVANLFKPFVGTKSRESSLGLGLSTAKGIAEEHNGSLYLHSNVPTIFVLKIPIEQVVSNEEAI